MAQLEEEKRLAEQQAQKAREEERRLAQEEERRQLEEQAADQPDVEIAAQESTPPSEQSVAAPQEESDSTDETKVWDGVPVTLPEAWSALESAWKTMVGGPVLEAEPEPLKREFEALANQTDNEIIASQAKRLLEAIDLFKLIQT